MQARSASKGHGRLGSRSKQAIWEIRRGDGDLSRP
jgi:hypothetical protein